MEPNLNPGKTGERKYSLLGGAALVSLSADISKLDMETLELRILAVSQEAGVTLDPEHPIELGIVLGADSKFWVDRRGSLPRLDVPETEYGMPEPKPTADQIVEQMQVDAMLNESPLRMVVLDSNLNPDIKDIKFIKCVPEHKKPQHSYGRKKGKRFCH